VSKRIKALEIPNYSMKLVETEAYWGNEKREE